MSAGTIQYLGGNTTVTVSATGGTGSLTGIGTFTRTAGTWSFTVTDVNLCERTETITILDGQERPVARKYKIRKQ